MLVVPFAFALVACGKNKDDVPAQETGGSGDSEQEVVIDTSYILNKAFVDFDAHTKTEVDETVCFSAKTENGYVYSEYDEFVYLGMSVLKALSEIELVEGKWCYGNEVVLEGESGYANKVSKFYILSEDIQNFTKITIYMMLEVEGFSGAKYVKTYDMYAYELKYYPVIDEVSVEAMIEKSRNSSSVSTNSTADYFVFSYNNGEILANTFSRIYEFDDLENFTSFNPRIISKYTSLKFDATSNEVLNKIDK